MITVFKIFEIQIELLVVFNSALHDEYKDEGEFNYDKEEVDENIKKLEDIVNRGADINYYYVGDYYLDGVYNNLKETLLIFSASQSNSLTYIDWLTEKGADWNVVNRFGFDFLELFVRLNRSYIFDEIVEKYPEKFRDYVWEKIAKVDNFEDLVFGPLKEGEYAVDVIDYLKKFAPDLIDKVKEVYPDKYERWEMNNATNKYNL